MLDGTLQWTFPESAYTSDPQDIPPGTYTFTYDVSTSPGKEAAVTQ